MSENFTLICPIRGILKTSAKSADGLRPSEEKLRIDAIKYLLNEGYPKENIKIEAIIKRFGNSGRNSFRADLAVLDVPVGSIRSGDIDSLLEHAILLGEVKRDNNAFNYVRNTQVEPMLDFATREDCIALYWDGVEQRVFWQKRVSGKRQRKEGSLALLPHFGEGVEATPLTFNDILPPESLLEIFRRIEDILHSASVDPEERYNIILQLLLAKLFDEHAHEVLVDPLEIQDFVALSVPSDIAYTRFESVLKKATAYYSRHLPRAVKSTISVTPDVLLEILQILAPIKIIAAKRDVVQAFYMHFAKHLYRWDLAQYFTPTTVTEFIIKILNPRFGEHIKDPACGSADFLTAAFRIGKKVDPNYADCVWGSDVSTNAVQVAVLNMLLNGDGKSNITEDDSLVNIDAHANEYDILVCNPPFGTKIIDSRPKVLAQFDLGYSWERDNKGVYQKTNRLLDKQETGLLFAEVCVKQARAGGRIALILPNGYLGNRSPKYHSFREWLLRNCKVASICSFPRFTFKTSGADVSASVIFLEKRSSPLNNAHETENHKFNIEMVQRVGWDVGNKRADPVYKRNPDDGSFLVGADGELCLDADFDELFADLKRSSVAHDFGWIDAEHSTKSGWSVDIGDVLREPSLCLDPKRYCKKVSLLRDQLTALPHLKLGEIVDFLPESRSTNGKSIKKVMSNQYRYVELQDVGVGDYSWTNLKGWELPSRAKHFAEIGDLYLGSIWGSVKKWFIVGNNNENLIVTNGCHRIRLKTDKAKYLPDLLAALCTDAYPTQMRSLARGSDGLAEVSPQDAESVIIPLIQDSAVRAEIEDFASKLLAGHTGINATVADLVNSKRLNVPVPPQRPTHSVLV
jgi:type I restriction enzyme M protein